MMRVGRTAIDYTHIPTLIYAIASVAIVATLKKFAPKVPNVLVAVLVVTTIISYFTGFNNDTVVDVSAIQAPTIAHQVHESNAATNLIEEHGGPSIEMLKLESEVKILTSHMNHAKEEAHLLRKALREMKFEAVRTGEDCSFYPQKQYPCRC